MTQSKTTAQPRTSLLNETAYRNPKYKEDEEKLAAHDKAIQEAKDKGNKDTATSDKQEPQHNWEKRYKDLQSYNSKKISSLENEIKALKQQGVPKIDVPKTPEEMEAFKEANPDTYAVIQTMAANIAQDSMKSYDAKLAQVNGDLLETRIERAELAIREAHPDVDTITKSDEFHQWAEKQTPDVQDWIYNNPDDPTKAIKAISLYKYETGLSQTTTQEPTKGPQGTQGADLDTHVRNATTPEATDRNHPAYVWKESDIARMRPEEFDKWQENILLAHQEGRILIGQ